MRDALRRELEDAVDGEVRFDKVSRALYSTDASVYQIEPLGVVIPKSAEAVARAVDIAARYEVPITPRGAGTSLPLPGTVVVTVRPYRAAGSCPASSRLPIRVRRASMTRSGLRRR